MMKTLSHPSYIKGLAVGLSGAIFVYGCALLWIFLSAHTTLETLQTQMARVDVLIEDKAFNKSSPIQKQAPENTVPPLEKAESLSSLNTPPPPSKNLESVAETGLVAAPIVSLHETVRGYELPKINQDGRTAYSAYKKPVPITDKPMIAIAILDYGLSKQASQMVLDTLPGTMSLILSPYSDMPIEHQEKARSKGHELWIHVMGENAEAAANDIGPQGLLSRAGIEQNQLRLYWNISRTPGVAGVAMYSDQVFMTARPLFQSILNTIFERGLGYFELNPNGPLFVTKAAGEDNAPYARNSMFLSENVEGLTEDLKTLEEIAQESGTAIGLIKPYPKLIEAVARWNKGLDSNQFAIVPISAVSDRYLQN